MHSSIKLIPHGNEKVNVRLSFVIVSINLDLGLPFTPPIDPIEI